jgi:hypothetical protein
MLTLIIMFVVYAAMIPASRLLFQERSLQGFAIFLTSIPILGLLWGLRSLSYCVPAALGGWMGMTLSMASIAWLDNRLDWQDVITLLVSVIPFVGLFFAGSLLGHWIKHQVTLRM